jgi:ParB family transcriptional regulator, chromosome partitioning protein
MAARKGLGRGLGALIEDRTPTDPPVAAPGGITRVAVESIQRNTWQPRRSFDAEGIAELAASIREHGILQPLLVRPAPDGYMLIAGERRLRAAGEVGLTEVPVIVMEATDNDALALALIENLQREDLNPIETAEGYRELAERFNLTQEDIAQRVGKSRAGVANALRLLALADEVRDLVTAGRLSVGHAKVLLALETEAQQIMYARRTVSEALSVRQLEKLIDRQRNTARKPRVAKADIPRNHLAYLSDRLHVHFGTSVRITPCRTFANGKKGKGCIEIDFFSNEDLDRMLTLVGLANDNEE